MPYSVWEIIEMYQQTGQRIAEKDFDMSIFHATERLRRQYDIRYDAKHPLPSDDDAADRLFQAALEFYTEVGTYCVNSGRAVRFSRQEIEEALKACSLERTVGEGADAVTYVHRDVEGWQEPMVTGGIQTALYSSDEMALKIYKGCCMDRCIDGLWGGMVATIEGRRPVIAGGPTEVFAFRRNAEIMRQATAAAGRPGMPIVNNAPSATATIAMYDAEKALRPDDGVGGAGIAEMKIDNDCFMRMAYGAATGMPFSAGSSQSTIGGFSGSIEGAAIVSVAGVFQGLMGGQGRHIGPGTSHFRLKSKMTREGLWVTSLATQALARNTHAIINGSGGEHPAAGPGTKQYFYETVAGVLANIISGAHHGSGTRKFVIGKTCDFGTPIESRFTGEVAKSAAGMTREQANELVLKMLDLYEPHLTDAPFGETYHELYDVEKEEPKEEYVRMYEEVKEELAGLGFHLRPTWAGRKG
ncbi:MAG: monomethylamine:corrinoid methyltransferase [Chloroflexi bacterium]|nr:monomethylamine:corrinoid methyltransferase [Chloroflexota bacterium]